MEEATAIERTQEEALCPAQADDFVLRFDQLFEARILCDCFELLTAADEEGVPVSRGQAFAFLPEHSFKATFTL